MSKITARRQSSSLNKSNILQALGLRPASVFSVVPNISVTSTKKEKSAWFKQPMPQHLVQLYNTENALLLPLHEYMSEGLLHDDTCVVIATSHHIQRLNERLETSGIDIRAAQQRGQYIALDAEATLTQFMKDGLPQRNSFYKVVGGVVDSALARQRSVRAYGEMVALLWEDGNKDAVIQLENLWNDLATSRTFSLYCAYPELHFITYGDELKQIINCHDINCQ